MSGIQKIQVLWKSSKYPHRNLYFARIFTEENDAEYEGYLSRSSIKVVKSNVTLINHNLI